MFDVVCVTNRLLCRRDFMTQLELVLQSGPAAIILREKDLSPEGYRQLAAQVMELCDQYGVLCILHNFYNEEAEAMHFPMHRLRELTDAQRQKFSVLGASCHSVAEAREAAALGCTYITAGHIFSTDCKKDLKPRGIDFLEEICASVDIPVYAIGGITSQTAGALKTMKIQGVCVMSGFMQCEDPAEYMKELKKGWEK